MKVEVGESGIVIDGHEVSYPTNVDALSKILGEPSRKYYERNDWRIIWDDLGVYASGIDINSLMFIVKQQDGFAFTPTHLFEGEVIVNGVPIQEHAESTVRVKKYQVLQARYMGEETNPVFLYTLGKNYDYKEEGNDTKYIPQKISGTPIVFTDLNFKLAIIEELMYRQELLVPKFDVTEFADWYKGRAINVAAEGAAPIPEALEYFKNLEIDEKFAQKVTSIEQDGGNDIYMNIAPQWSGEDDTFTIGSIDDAASFPNLKEAVLFYDEEGDEILEAFRARGIKADWL